jgi:hypothetical protein
MLSAHSLPPTHEHGLFAAPASSVSSPGPTFQMPTVLVYPPEDEAMPWCAFDAGQDSAEAELVFTTPEMELLQSELDDWPQAVHPHAEHLPASFHGSQADCAVIPPRRGSSHRSLSGGANLRRLSSIPESPKRVKERDDDDIVEVMKVRRGEGMPDVAYAHGSVPTLRRSKTLRSRAAQALRSIKNVGKAPRRPTLEHVVPAKENRHSTETKDPAPTEVPPTPTAEKHRKMKSSRTASQSSIPRLKKRVSQPLSSLFGLGLGSSESAPNTANAIGLDVSSSHSGGFRTMPYSRSASASTPALQLFKDKDEARPTSPTFSIRGTRHKLSFGNLQSIFSGNMANASEPVLEAQQAAADPEADDTAQPRMVQTPDIEDGWDDSEDYDSPRRHSDLGTMRRPSDESFFPEQEISFEMRLNSMHFDSFSIDADAF